MELKLDYDIGDEVCGWLKANAHFCVSEFTGTLDEDMLVKMLKEGMSNGKD